MMPSSTAGHHQRRRRKSSLKIISMISFVCILSSIIVFSSKLGTSNNLNIDENDNLLSVGKTAGGSSYYQSSALRRGSGGGGISTAMQSSAHRFMQTSSQRCIKISIFLDQYPADTTWIITDELSGSTVITSPAYDASMALTQQVETTCLAPGSYVFTISDDYEDGLCCLWGEGNYTVSTLLPSTVGSSNVEILASGGAWIGPNETTTFLLTEAPPTNMPTLQPTNALTLQPTIMYTVEPTVERINVTSQVNVYLTGVPTNQNMTIAEQEVFETLFYTVLQSRLETVDVDVWKVVVDTQINDPLFDADSPFDSDNNDGKGGAGGGGGGGESVLQLLTNITFTYSDPPPEGWRDWSIYLTSWVESFGPTMVDIFTDPKHDLYPNEEFFNSISDVSATNVVPPNTDPTLSPTLSPTYLGAPEYKKPLVTGLASAGVIAVVLFFAGALWWKQRRLKMTRTHNISSSYIPEERGKKKKDDDNDKEEDDLDSLDDEENLHEEEDSTLQDDMLLVSTLPPTVPKSNNKDMRDDDDEDDRGVDDNDDSDECDDDDDEVGSGEINVQASPIILEETPTPRQEPLVVAAMPNEAQYDKIVEAVLANDPNLTQVVLDNKRQIGNDGGEALWQALTMNNHVKVLSLQNSNITDDQMAALALALNENTSISSLFLQNNMFTSEGVEYLVVCLECNSTIKMVALEGNSTIDPRILEELRGILQSRVGHDNVNKTESLLERIRSKGPNLTQLDLHGMGIGPNDTDAIMEALAGNVHLRKVDLSSNMIDDDGVSALSLALADDTSITHLCLADNRITSIGAEYLLCALDTNTTIVDVDLAGNSIEAEVIAEVNHALKLRRTVDGC